MLRLAIALNLALFLASCQKETPPVPVQPTREDTMSRTWTIKDAKENGATTADFNGNTITFNKDHTYKAVSPFETVTGTWQLNADKSHVVFDANSKPDELLSDWEILEMSNVRFRWKWTHNQETIEATMEP